MHGKKGKGRVETMSDNPTIKRKYNVKADLPKCADCGKAEFEDENLQDYSDAILELVVKETDKAIASLPGALGFSCPGADIEGREVFRKNVERDRKSLQDLRLKVTTELETRKKNK